MKSITNLSSLTPSLEVLHTCSIILYYRSFGLVRNTRMLKCPPLTIFKPRVQCNGLNIHKHVSLPNPFFLTPCVQNHDNAPLLLLMLTTNSSIHTKLYAVTAYTICIKPTKCMMHEHTYVDIMYVQHVILKNGLYEIPSVFTDLS